MKDAGNGNERKLTMQELLERARARGNAEPEQPEKEKEKGLEFMPVRLNVVNKVFELTVTKKITPAERNLVDLIEIGTVGAQNSKRQFSTKAEFVIDDLSSALRYKEKDKIWKLLKSLDKKKVITREKTRFKNVEILGLNEEMMGQILINTHHEEEKKRFLRIVVDNSKDEPTNRPSSTDESSVNNLRSVGDSPTNHPQNTSQVLEIKGENSLLDSYRLNLNSSRFGAGSFNYFSKGNGSGEMSEDQAAERKAFLLRQADMLKQQEAAAK